MMSLLFSFWGGSLTLITLISFEKLGKMDLTPRQYDFFGFSILGFFVFDIVLMITTGLRYGS